MLRSRTSQQHALTERRLFRVAVAVVAAHTVMDAFPAREPGTSAGEHLLSAGVPLALLLAAATFAPRLRAGAFGSIAIALGMLSLPGFGVAYAHATRAATRGDDWTGFLLLPAGLLLIAIGLRALWRSRRSHGRRFLRRGALLGAAVLGMFWIVIPTGVALVATHRPREAATPVDLGAQHEDVSVLTADRLELHARYVQSRNRAAVIVFPGSNSRAPQARALVRHGYGVLMLDMRGYRDSDGDPNAYGWGATKDVAAGVAFLRSRRDVRAGRIGGLGFSVGGEQLLEAAAENPRLRAVVADGAGERSVRESVLRGARGWLAIPLMAAQTAAVTILSGDAPPPALQDVIAKISPRPLLLIYTAAGNEELTPQFFRSARAPKAIWKIPEAGHTGGFTARPRAYERRLVDFFDQALLR